MGWDVPRQLISENRDHILVVTEGGKLASVRLRDVLEVRPALRSGGSVVVTNQGKLEIQEGRSVFVERCKGLMGAVLDGYPAGIDRFFCPGVLSRD